jgi:hypothetical protein
MDPEALDAPWPVVLACPFFALPRKGQQPLLPLGGMGEKSKKRGKVPIHSKLRVSRIYTSAGLTSTFSHSTGNYMAIIMLLFTYL